MTRLFISCWTAALLLGIATTAHGQGTDHLWNNNLGGNWNMPGNWLPTSVPGAMDRVFITQVGTYNITLDINPSIGALTFLGQNNSNPTLIIPGGRTLTIGTNGPSHINPTGSLVLNGTGSQTATLAISGAPTLDNQGIIVTHGLAAMNLTFASSFHNTAVGTLSVQSGFNNDQLTISNSFQNDGVIQIVSINGGFQSRMTVNNGTLTNNSNGLINVQQGTGGARTLTAELDNFGELRLNWPLTIDQPAAHHVNEASGIININASASLTINRTGNAPFVSNLGTINLTGGGLAIGGGGTNMAFINSGILNITGGDLTITGGNTTNNATIILALGHNLIQNGGTFNQNSNSFAGPGTATFALNQAALNLIQSFTTGVKNLVLTQCSVNGPGSINNTSLVEFDGTNSIAVNIDNESGGIMRLRGVGSTSSSTMSGTLMIGPAGALHIQPNTGFAVGLTVSGAVENSGYILMQSLNTAGNASLTIGADALTNHVSGGLEFRAGAGGSRTLNAQINNQGNIFVNTSATIANASTGHNNSGVITIASGQTLTLGTGGKTALYTNNGFISIQGGTLQATFTPSSQLVNNGGISVESGGMMAVTGGSFYNAVNGRLLGTGTFNLSSTMFTNDGLLSPGDTGVGALQITGPCTQTSSSRIAIDINGPAPVSQFDVLQATGTVSLAGRMNVTLGGGYLPIAGTSFNVVDAGSLAGQFGLAVFNAAFPDGRYLSLSYVNNNDNDDGDKRGGNTAVFHGVTVTVNLFNDVVIFNPGPTAPLPGTPTAGVLGDFDADGDVDLAVTITNGNNPGSVVILYNAGTDINGHWLGFAGSSQVPVGVNPSGIATGQFDNNQSFDLAVSNMGSNSITILLNNGSGIFTPQVPVITLAPGAQPTSIASAEFNVLLNDSAAPGGGDLVTTNGGTNSIQVFINQGNGTFVPSSPIAAGIMPVHVNPADVDNDRDIDIVIVNAGSHNAMVYHNNNGLFGTPDTYPVGNSPRDVLVRRLNNDLLPEIVVANSGDGTVSVLLNNPAAPGTFTAAPPITVGPNVRSLASLDYQDDGDLDVAVLFDLTGASTVQILRNDPAAGASLLLSQGDTLAVGSGAVVVLAGNMGRGSDEDIVTVNSGLTGVNDSGDRGRPALVNPSVSVLLNNTGPPCIGDITPPPHGNGTVNVDDLLYVINHWGAAGGGSAADIVPPGGNGVVNVDDLLAVINHWGACP